MSRTRSVTAISLTPASARRCFAWTRAAATSREKPGRLTSSASDRARFAPGRISPPTYLRKQLENAGQDGSVNADAVVAHGDHGIGTRGYLGILVRIGLINHHVGRPNCDPAAVRESIARVHDEIEDGRLELGSVDFAAIECRIELEPQFDRRTGGMTQECFEFQQHAIEIERDRPHHAASREHQQLFDKVLTAFNSLKRSPRNPRDASGVLWSSYDQFEVTADNG